MMRFGGVLDMKVKGVQLVVPVLEYDSATVQAYQLGAGWTSTGTITVYRSSSAAGPWNDLASGVTLVGPGPKMSGAISLDGIGFIGVGVSVVDTSEVMVEVWVTLDVVSV